MGSHDVAFLPTWNSFTPHFSNIVVEVVTTTFLESVFMVSKGMLHLKYFRSL